MSNLAETIEQQNAVIRIQSEVIDELFILLLQHITAEEADRLPAIEKINTAAKLREKIPGAEPYE
ncbi:MAG: hypothetical protein IJT16_02160 [Lachnospiraceae bacterium]|nr:hypothetical protein [Lachnospiraceae bacterium]